MAVGTQKLVVFVKAVEGRRDELAHWYDTQHLNDLIAVPGIVRVERNEFMAIAQPPGTPAWDFFLIYEVEGAAMDVLKAMAPLQGTDRMPGTDAIESKANLLVAATMVTEKVG